MHLILFLSFLLLHCLLLITNVGGVLHPDELAFYLNNDENEFICVADGNAFDSAVDFIYPIKNDTGLLPKIQTYFEPKLNSTFVCDITKGQSCNEHWSIDNWKIETYSPLNFVPILDTRWEKFDMILTKNNKPSDNIRLPNQSERINVTISIRALNNAEILLCDGYDLKKYKCNGIEINEKEHTFIIKRYDKGITNGANIIKKINMNQSFVISPNEWRTYTLSIKNNKSLTLIDVINMNQLFDYNQEENMKAIYLFLRSNDSALWKVHKNDFLYTNNIGTSKFAKEIEFNRTDYCISIRTAMCLNCKLTLFKNVTGNEEIIANLTAQNDNDWKFNKIFIKSMYVDKLQLYIKTELIDTKKNGNVYWAIDDVRECTRKELRVYRLKDKNVINSKVSCQCLKHPQLRPEIQILPKFKELPTLKFDSTSTSIDVSWKDNPEIGTIHPHYYVVGYKGRAQCDNETEKDIKRTQSMDYDIIVNNNNVTFNELVPYTHYNVTFKDILYDKFLMKNTNTNPIDIPTNDTLPQSINCNTTETTAICEWNSPKCYNTFGPIVYNVTILGVNNGTPVFHSQFATNNLKANTNYTVIIATKIRMITKETPYVERKFNFSTSSGIANQIENVEVYATDKNFVNIRYNLPKTLNGTPSNVLVTYCHALLEKCYSNQYKIKKCQMWNDKYCLQINKLMSNFNYTFELALKNVNTSTYGKSNKLWAVTTQKVPNKPTNLSMATLNCTSDSYDCHLIINWTYPYNPNGAIHTFDININTEIIENNINKTEYISSTAIVTDNSNATFSQTVRFVPYSKTYRVHIKSCNVRVCSIPETVTLNNNNLPNLADKSPKLIAIKDKSLTFQLRKISDEIATTSSPSSPSTRSLYVIVQDYDKINKSAIMPINLTHGLNYKLCNNHGNAWVSAYLHLNESVSNLVIGDDKKYDNYHNKPLKDNTTYCIIFLFITDYNDNSKYLTVYYEEDIKTKETIVEKSSSIIYIVLLVLAIKSVILGWFIYRYWKKGRIRLWFRRIRADPSYVYINSNLISNDVYESN